MSSSVTDNSQIISGTKTSCVRTRRMSLSSATSIFPQRNRTYVPTEVLQRHAPLTSQRTRSTTTHITRTIWYGTLASRGQGSSACLPLQPTDPQAQRARRANCLQQQQPAISHHSCPLLCRHQSTSSFLQ